MERCGLAAAINVCASTPSAVLALFHAPARGQTCERSFDQRAGTFVDVISLQSYRMVAARGGAAEESNHTKQQDGQNETDFNYRNGPSAY